MGKKMKDNMHNRPNVCGEWDRVKLEGKVFWENEGRKRVKCGKSGEKQHGDAEGGE